MKKRFVWPAVLVPATTLAVFIVAACGDDAPPFRAAPGADAAATTPSCYENPEACPQGQTCWFMNQPPSRFQCVEAGVGTAGATCVSRAGIATCSDDMLCMSLFVSNSTGSGTTTESKCLRYCNPDAGGGALCSPGTECRREAFTNLLNVAACFPQLSPDGG